MKILHSKQKITIHILFIFFCGQSVSLKKKFQITAAGQQILLKLLARREKNDLFGQTALIAG